jgi:hypothetical protein
METPRPPVKLEPTGTADRSGRALDVRRREIFAFVEKRSAADLGLSAAFKCSRLGVASDSPVRIGATADASTTITSRR